MAERNSWFLDQGGFGSPLGNAEVSLGLFCSMAMGFTDGERHGVSQLCYKAPRSSLLWQLARVFQECSVKIFDPKYYYEHSSPFKLGNCFLSGD